MRSTILPCVHGLRVRPITCPPQVLLLLACEPCFTCIDHPLSKVDPLDLAVFFYMHDLEMFLAFENRCPITTKTLEAFPVITFNCLRQGFGTSRAEIIVANVQSFQHSVCIQVGRGVREDYDDAHGHLLALGQEGQQNQNFTGG